MTPSAPFNGAGDLHHRKEATRGPADLRAVLPSTEPVIFITGKVERAVDAEDLVGPSTEPVIFITGKIAEEELGVPARALLQRSR